MARKTLIVTIADENRDKGKVFALTEMDAERAEEWAFRAISALVRGGVEVPENFMDMAPQALAALGFQALAGVRFEDAKPLFDEMMDCVRIRPDPRHPEVERPLVSGDIEEVVTRLKLRREVFGLHLDFFPGAKTSTST